MGIKSQVTIFCRDQVTFYTLPLFTDALYAPIQNHKSLETKVQGKIRGKRERERERERKREREREKEKREEEIERNYKDQCSRK